MIFFLSIGAFLIFTVLLICVLISKPEKGWIFNFILVCLLPFVWHAGSSLVDHSGPFHPYALIFLPLVVMTMLIFVIWVSNQIAMREQLLLKSGPLSHSFLFFIAANILSLVNAKDVMGGITIILAWVYLFITYFAIYNSITKPSQIDVLVKALILTCLVLSLYGWFLWISGISGKGINPFEQMYLESNHFAFIAMVAMFLSMFLSAAPSQNFFARLFYFISFFSLLISVIFTLSRGAWISCGAVLLWVAITRGFRGRYRSWLGWYACLGVLFGLVIISTNSYLLSRFMTISKGAEASVSRYEMDLGAFYTFLEHPFLGVGTNNFVVYSNALKREIAGTANLYSRVLAETGIIGFITFILLMTTIYRALSKGVMRASLGSKQQLILLGFQAGFVANAIDFLFFGLIHPLPWMAYFLGVTYAKMVADPLPLSLVTQNDSGYLKEAPKIPVG